MEAIMWLDIPQRPVWLESVDEEERVAWVEVGQRTQGEKKGEWLHGPVYGSVCFHRSWMSDLWRLWKGELRALTALEGTIRLEDIIGCAKKIEFILVDDKALKCCYGNGCCWWWWWWIYKWQGAQAGSCVIIKAQVSDNKIQVSGNKSTNLIVSIVHFYF